MPLNILQEIIDEILDGTAVSTFVSITPDHPRGTLLDYTSFSKGWAYGSQQCLFTHVPPAPENIDYYCRSDSLNLDSSSRNV